MSTCLQMQNHILENNELHMLMIYLRHCIWLEMFMHIWGIVCSCISQSHAHRRGVARCTPERWHKVCISRMKPPYPIWIIES